MKEINSGMRAPWPTTHWSLIGRAGALGAEERREAISGIVRIYSPVLRRHLAVRWGIQQHRLDDLLHDFFLSKILSAGIVGLADQTRGRFRTFLGTAMDNFVRNHYRDEGRRRRRENHSQSITNELEDCEVLADPGDSFDYAWARQVLGQSIRQLRIHCRRTNRPDVWGVFQGRVLRPTLLCSIPTPYAMLVKHFGLATPRRATNILVTGVRLFERSLRAVIGRYQEDKEDIDREIQDLWKAVSVSKGKISIPLTEER